MPQRPARRDRPWSVIAVVVASLAIVGVGLGGRLSAVPSGISAPSRAPATHVSPTAAPPSSPSPSIVAERTVGPLADLADAPGTLLDVLHRPGRTAGSWTQTLGPVEGGTIALTLVCSGPGRLEIGPLSGGPRTEGDCDGKVRDGVVELGPGRVVLYATSNARSAWHVVARPPFTGPLPTPSGMPIVGGLRPSAIGAADEAITVVPIEAANEPATGLLVRGVRPDGTTRDIATIPASAFPVNAKLRLFDARPVVSRQGYLVVPFEEDGASPSAFGAVFDLGDPAAPPTIVGDRLSGFAWSPDGGLAAPSGDGVDIWSPVIGSLAHVSSPGDVSAVTATYEGAGVVWTIANALVADRSALSGPRRGVLSLDGSFEPDVPTITYAPFGTERHRSSDGRVVGEGCDSSGADGASGCVLVVEHEDETDLVRWSGGFPPGSVGLPLWTATGDALWFLHDDLRGTRGVHRITLARSSRPTTSRIVARATTDEIDGYVTIVGATGRDEVIALDLAGQGTMLIDTHSGRSVVGAGIFAGWADNRAFIYPAAGG